MKPGDGTAASRDVLRRRVRRAVAAAADETEFFALLDATGVTVRLKRGPSGDALGCNFALPGDTNDQGEPVFYAGSTLAPGLSLPRIRQRLAAASPQPVPSPGPATHGWSVSCGGRVRRGRLVQFGELRPAEIAHELFVAGGDHAHHRAAGAE